MQSQQKKMKAREASDWSHHGVNYFAFVERKILSVYFTIIKNGVPGVFPLESSHKNGKKK